MNLALIFLYAQTHTHSFFNSLSVCIAIMTLPGMKCIPNTYELKGKELMNGNGVIYKSDFG